MSVQPVFTKVSGSNWSPLGHNAVSLHRWLAISSLWQSIWWWHKSWIHSWNPAVRLTLFCLFQRILLSWDGFPNSQGQRAFIFLVPKMTVNNKAASSNFWDLLFINKGIMSQLLSISYMTSEAPSVFQHCNFFPLKCSSKDSDKCTVIIFPWQLAYPSCFGTASVCSGHHLAASSWSSLGLSRSWKRSGSSYK